MPCAPLTTLLSPCMSPRPFCGAWTNRTSTPSPPVWNRRNETYDEIILNAGVRSFAVTPDGGFSINGVATPLRGVSRHQDRLYKGNALTAEDHYEDAQIIKDLGANTIRLAHYQHSQDFYDACDQLGFAVWAEIPFISVFKTCAICS